MAKGIVIQITGDPSSAKAALELVREQMQETAEAAREDGGAIADVFERAKGALETIGLYMGLREAIQGIRELAGGALELGETLEKASQKTGLSVESLSVLHYAAKVTGSDFEGLTTAIGRMDNTIGKAADGNKQAQAFM